jgi:hypothetical protein
MKYKIVIQDMSIGWKEWDEKGKPTTNIVEYDSLLDLLKGEGFFDENYDEDEDEEVENPDIEFSRMLKALEEDGYIMTDEHDMRYWAEPEPCDSYLTYGTKYTISELSDEDLVKIQAIKDKANASEIATNKKKWDVFLKDHQGTSNGDLLETLMKEYKFPTKLKSLV